VGATLRNSEEVEEFLCVSKFIVVKHCRAVGYCSVQLINVLAAHCVLDALFSSSPFHFYTFTHIHNNEAASVKLQIFWHKHTSYLNAAYIRKRIG